MTTASTVAEEITRLAARRDCWTFRGYSAHSSSPVLFQYPAMMVPQMQRELLAVLAGSRTHIAVYDPFAGSGTTMDEALLGGFDYTGSDLNPLAVLICLAKAGPFATEELATSAYRTLARARRDTGRAREAQFRGIDKWFRREVALDLSRLRRAIRREPELHARRFLWTALAETVRLTSNSRLSTVKLHARPRAEIAACTVDTIETFERVVLRNLEQLERHRGRLATHGRIRGNRYRGRVRVAVRDARTAPARGERGRAHVLLTSPPYGDNTSTVPYGQHSYLPLQWIDLDDIEPGLDEQLLANTHRLDTLSLGGLRKDSDRAAASLAERSPAFHGALLAQRGQPRDRASRLTAFCRDLDTALDPVLARMESRAWLALTLGNRRIGGHAVPTDRIVRELLEVRGCEYVVSVRRKIPHNRKRMPTRNSIANTIARETVVVMRAP